MVSLLAILLISLSGQPVYACVEGLAWGMTLDQVHAHLGQAEPLNRDQSGRFEAQQVLLDQLPVSRVTFDLDPQNGLSSLAYEFALDDMTEVLAGLRARHGSPLSTSVEAGDRNDQIWVWNTGDDLITAVKRNAARQQQFLVSYRPSRLRPETL